MPRDEKHRQAQHNWYLKNKEAIIAKQRKRRRQIRLRVLEMLGGKCAYCGCDVIKALEINHKDGGGNQEMRDRKNWRRQYYLDILSGRRTTDDLELTCKICNAWHHLTKLMSIPDRWKITWN